MDADAPGDLPLPNGAGFAGKGFAAWATGAAWAGDFWAVAAFAGFSSHAVRSMICGLLRRARGFAADPALMKSNCSGLVGGAEEGGSAPEAPAAGG